MPPESEETMPPKRILLKQALNRLAKTDDGKVVLRHIMEVSGFKDYSAVFLPSSEYNVYAMVHNEAIRSFYLSLRKLIAPTILDVIETNEEIVCEINDIEDSIS
jgi:hypothetical protein